MKKIRESGCVAGDQPIDQSAAGPKPAVMITTPMLSFTEPVLAEAYDVRRLWEADPGVSLPGIRGLACLGNAMLTPVLDRLPDLEIVACFTTGYDGIDLALCEERGIAVTHAPSASAPAVAEYALALTLALVRNVLAGSRIVTQDKWIGMSEPLISGSLKDAHVGVVGLGDIGRTFAGFAQALGARVSWWGPRPKPEASWPRASSLLELARESDVLVVCARADASNVHLLSAEVLSAMPSHAVLVNVARGQLIDEDVLIGLLREGRIAGAALDVFESEPTPAARWADLPNVIVTPHLAGATRPAINSMTAMMRDNLDRHFRGAPLANPVSRSALA